MSPLVAETQRKPRRLVKLEYGDGAADERQTPENLRSEGSLQRRKRSLESFFSARRHELLLRVGDASDEAQLIAAARQMILDHGAIDPLAEAIDQIREMQFLLQSSSSSRWREPNDLACEWADGHAARWRQRRTAEYLFVIEGMGERLADCLRAR